FEDYTSCPDYWDQLGGNVAGWNTCANSPDFFHTCRDSSDFGVPLNWRGYQEASHGQGYGGVISYQWNASHYREFICTELSQPMLPGAPMDLSMKVAMGGAGSYWLFSPKWTTRGIGMLLTTEPFEWSTGSLYPNNAQLFMDAVFTDTSNWVVLSTTYVPDSVYRYITLGNFFDDSLSLPVLMDTVFGNQNIAYVYIDEVCIAPVGMGCDFASGIEPAAFGEWQVYSPFSESIQITFTRTLERGVELFLHDIDGRLAAQRWVDAGTTNLVWPVHQLASGLYVLRSTEKNPGLKPICVLHLTP
ncbi:MAG: hypothetical protein ABI599_02405, partial [Flavobacteriales bacterium]